MGRGAEGEPRADAARLRGGRGDGAADLVKRRRSTRARGQLLARDYAAGWPAARGTDLGVWLEQALYFDGIPTAYWARNMAANPSVALHLESGTDVVILDGIGEDVASVGDPDLAARIVGAWDSKYGRLHPDPVANGLFRFRPRTARAWSQFPDDATRWTFDKA